MNKPLSKFKQRKLKVIEALESGKYKQGNGRLRRNDEFCCLGVMCEIHRISEPPDDNQDGRRWSGPGDKRYLLNNTQLPEQVVKWFGLPLLVNKNRTVQIKTKHVKEVLSQKEAAMVTNGKGLDSTEYKTKVDIIEINDSHVPFKKIARLMRLQFNLPKGK